MSMAYVMHANRTETDMGRRRTEMIEETREKLITAARSAFASRGYADTVMDELTTEAGLTRGALYHHFDGKRGLLEAVIAQIDDEMTQRLDRIMDEADSRWEGLVEELSAYVEMALQPEIQRIVFLDGPAVLGNPSRWPSQLACVRTTAVALESLIDEGTLVDLDPKAMAPLISGAALSGALWIANADDPTQASRQVVQNLAILLKGLRQHTA
jgi:AcrR family transcriptional regulator